MQTLKQTHQAGFTLIETLMAMAIFTIGILGLFGMQTAVIKQNLAANTITTGATWAADQVERLIGLPYIHDDLNTTVNCEDLDNRNFAINNGYTATSGIVEPIYTIYWNVALNCTLIGIPNAPPTQPQNEQKPKYVKIIVTRFNDNGQEVEAAVFDYIKQNVRTDT
jgi:prepilin-type N-terminal cleavage/methylation domain-containing protein